MASVYQKLIGEYPITIAVGGLAQQAGGAVTVRLGDTVMLVTACVGPQREGTDFLPLTVDYEERHYAAGKIPGGYIRREGRPSQEATLGARLTDRPIRPLFPKGFINELQVVITVLSADQEHLPEVLALVGASAALSISPIPFAGPIAAVRVGAIGGSLVLNPTYSQLKESSLDMIVAGTSEAVIMVEAGAKEVPESLLLEALQVGQEANRALVEFQREIIRAHGQPKMEFTPKGLSPEAAAAVSAQVGLRLPQIFAGSSKQERGRAQDQLKAEVMAKLGQAYPPHELAAALELEIKKYVRRSIVEKGRRSDGRAPKEIRPISCEVGLLPRTHGSGLFNRGETQVLSIATLGSMREEQMLDTLSPEESRRFLHHYNFPPFSNGETGRIGAPRRREIGHGALVERALEPVVPTEGEFPYTIRVVSEVLSSNGSTSMASICASTLSLMDAGVPIKAPVAGVAMGLIKEGDRYAILTDIAGSEDAMGDMDFKVAGTAAGVTALQLDMKISGIDHRIMTDALAQAHEARLFILERMKTALAAPRPELNPYAPRMTRIQVHPDKIRLVIGPGGKTIRAITEATKATIDVEDDGTIVIGSSSREMTDKAIKMIEALTQDVKVGGIYTGKVVRIMNFGAFVEVLPGKDGLVPIGELADYRVGSVEDVVKIGDEITVVVTEIDRMGRVNLSRRALLQKEGGAAPASAPAPAQAPVDPDYPFRSGPPAAGDGPRSPEGPRHRPSREAPSFNPARPRPAPRNNP